MYETKISCESFKSHTWLGHVTNMDWSCQRGKTWRRAQKHSSVGTRSGTPVLQCVAVCCSVLPCIAVCCSVLQCVAVHCSVLQCIALCCSVMQCDAVWCSVMQCDAVWCECCRGQELLCIEHLIFLWHLDVRSCRLKCTNFLKYLDVRKFQDLNGDGVITRSCCFHSRVKFEQALILPFLLCAEAWQCLWACVPMCATRLILVCDMTHSYVWHDSFLCVTWLIFMCYMTYSYVWHDSFLCVCENGLDRYAIEAYLCSGPRSKIT